MFVPQQIIQVSFATSKFNACKIRTPDGTIKQFMPDLPKVKQDCAWLEDAITKYGNVDFGPDNMFKMTDGPDYSTVMKTKKQLFQKLKQSKHKKTLVSYVFAGHGMQENGTQVVVINEYDKETRFYRLWKIENMIRTFARMFPNSFHLAFFACCREIFNPEYHRGGYTGTDEEVAKHFKEQDEKMKAAQASQDKENEDDQDLEEFKV